MPRQTHETPAEHCRNALMELEALQGLLLADPRMTPVLLDERLRLLAGARGRLWEAVWQLEGSAAPLRAV